MAAASQNSRQEVAPAIAVAPHSTVSLAPLTWRLVEVDNT
jgi:hypothetical protein